MASDSASDYEQDTEQDSSAVNNPQHEEPFSIDVLLRRLEEVQRNEDPVALANRTRAEEVQRSEELAVLQKLTRRSVLLQQLIIDYQQQWCCMLNLLEKTNEAQKSVQKAVEHCVNQSAAAERAWLAYWGIKKEHMESPMNSYSSPGWI
jgi:hypothetical protein